MSRLTSLPDEVLKIIVHYIPPKDRLSNCCLVNRRLHAAAVAVEDLVLGPMDADAAINVSTPTQAQAVKTWLENNRHYLTRLQMHDFPQVLQQLPCHNLVELVLTGMCSVQLGPAKSGQLGVIQGCTKLTHLELSCRVLDATASVPVAGLSCLVHLQHLDMQPRGVGWPGINGLSVATLPCLQHLTALDVKNLSVDNMLQLGGLTALQELWLRAFRSSHAVGPSSIPGLVLPPSLKQLGFMSHVYADVLSLVPTGLQDLTIDCAVMGPAEGPGSFLYNLARLQHLTELYIDTRQGLLWPRAGPAYSALTASSSLKSLCVKNAELPEGVWQRVFCAGRHLPHLTYLCFDALDGETAAWDAGALASLVNSCPNLREMRMLPLQPGRYVSQLQQLTALTRLNVLYEECDVPSLQSSLEGVAAVTQLRDLSACLETYGLSRALLLPLTHRARGQWRRLYGVNACACS